MLEHTLSCDRCGVAAPSARSLPGVRAEAKELGWRVEPDWTAFCPNCAQPVPRVRGTLRRVHGVSASGPRSQGLSAAQAEVLLGAVEHPFDTVAMAPDDLRPARILERKGLLCGVGHEYGLEWFRCTDAGHKVAGALGLAKGVIGS